MSSQVSLIHLQVLSSLTLGIRPPAVKLCCPDNIQFFHFHLMRSLRVCKWTHPKAEACWLCHQESPRTLYWCTSRYCELVWVSALGTNPRRASTFTCWGHQLCSKLSVTSPTQVFCHPALCLVPDTNLFGKVQVLKKSFSFKHHIRWQFGAIAEAGKRHGKPVLVMTCAQDGEVFDSFLFAQLISL